MNTQLAHPARPVILAAFSLLLALGLPGQASGLQVHQQIQGTFSTAHEVTVKCQECHPQQAEDVPRSTHWTWVRQRTINGTVADAGKRDSLAGFAIDVTTNPARCLRCHISTSPRSESFTSPAADMVDCLACHDTTGLYRHAAGTPGQGQPPDLAAMVRNAGRPTPRNCTGCHFADCGLSPFPPQAEESVVPDLTDIHLRASGPAFTCQTCHLRGSGHAIARQVGDIAATRAPGDGCTSCHTTTPHTLARLNQHARTISCQACHIPAYAQGRPALIAWNWLMTDKKDTVFRAGTGSKLQLRDQNGFWSASDIEPMYLWDNGGDQVYTRGQKIKPHELTILQQPAAKSAGSKLAPFRVLYGTQLYDSKYRYLISPLLHPDGPVLFPGSDWDTLARQGMEALVLPFSGQYGFTATVTYRRINHGVVPAAQALDCLDCHGATGRIGWEMLGFDRDPMSDSPATENAQPPQPQSNAIPPPPPPVQEPQLLPPIQEPAAPSGTARRP